MYTEASGRRKYGDKARLVGPVIPHDQPVCMEFWFHMLGFHIGQLNVYVKVGKKLNSNLIPKHLHNPFYDNVQFLYPP